MKVIKTQTFKSKKGLGRFMLTLPADIVGYGYDTTHKKWWIKYTIEKKGGSNERSN